MVTLHYQQMEQELLSLEAQLLNKLDSMEVKVLFNVQDQKVIKLKSVLQLIFLLMAVHLLQMQQI